MGIERFTDLQLRLDQAVDQVEKEFEGIFEAPVLEFVAAAPVPE